MIAYVLVANNIVINGPRSWNYRSFQNSLEEELEISYTLPITKANTDPIEIANGVVILPVEETRQNYNSKIEYLEGPFWAFSNTLATATYTISSNDISAVKNDLKAKVAVNRYIKETGVLQFTIPSSNTTVTVDTSREGRGIYLEKLQILTMANIESSTWKFPEGFYTLTASDLAMLVGTGAAFIQAQFDWESAKVAEIDACSTLEELDAVELE